MDINELLKSIKELTGINDFQHHSVSEKKFEVWVSEPDSIGSFILVDRSGNIAVYEKTADGADKIYLNVYTLEDFKLDYEAVRMMIKIENHPELIKDTQITSGVELLEWTEENDLLLHLDPVEARAVMDAYSETGYGLYHDDKGNLYMDKYGKAEKICIDDVIDLAGERSYEDISKLKEELEKAPTDKSMVSTAGDFSKHLDRFTDLLHLEMRNKSIISAYSKTIYGKRYYYNYQYTTPAINEPKKTRKI